MKIHNVLQGSEDWFEVRKLKLTGSKATAIASNGTGLKTLVTELILDMFIEKECFTNKDIERGNELETIAREKYSFENKVDVIEVGFIEHTEHSGYSPDGLVNSDGLVEIKARNNKIHLELLQTQNIDTGTVWQMQMGLLITDRKWCDFISYNPNFKNSMFVKRVYRDEDAILKLKNGIIEGTKMIKLMLNDNIVKEEIEHITNGNNIIKGYRNNCKI
jgi:hypothetical protein